MPKIFKFFLMIAATCLIVALPGRVGGSEAWFNSNQILSITIFSTFIYGTLLFGEFRLAFAFGGIALLLAIGLLDVPGFTESANLKVIVFLIGMFLVIGFLEENQFFEHIVAMIVARVGPRPKLLLLVLMLMGTIAAALVDEVTSILFMTGTLLHLTSKYKLNPLPYVIMLVFATNIGSAMSAIGNPIGVMIALNAPFSFIDFVRWSAPVAIVVNITTYFICRWWYADHFAAFADAVAQQELELKSQPASGSEYSSEGASDEGDNMGQHRNMMICWAVFASTVLLLVMHGTVEHLMRLQEGTMMIGSALLMGAVVLLIRRERARELVERRVDWWTLSFFMMLFASVGTLEHTGVTGVIARKLIASTGSNQFLLINVVGWATGWLSAFLDNVLAVATFMPVVHDVRVSWALQHSDSPGYSEAIYWFMLFGGTFMGNMTVIGSTANIIAVGVLEKRGHGTVKFGEWFKIGFIVSIASMIVATVMLQLLDWIVGIPMLAPPGAQMLGH